MPEESIKDVLIRRDGMTSEEADDLINEVKTDLHARLSEGDIPFDICE